MAEKKDVLKIMAILASVYVRDVNAMTPEQKSQMATTWASMLKDIPVDILDKAVECHIKTSKWMPTVAELRTEAVASIDKYGGETASLAFSTILREITRGTRRDNAISEVGMEALRAVGGWGDVGRSTEVGFLRNEFIKAYNQIKESYSRTNQTMDFSVIAARLKANQKCLT